MKAPQILLSVDVEDWFQVENFKNYISYESWPEQGRRYEASTHKLLELFEQNDVLATFFMLGWNAERSPGLARAIVENGHELASHGYDHHLNTALSENALREDLLRSRKTLEDITGVAIKGYRAPSFSVTPATIRLLKELGYSYDASLNQSSVNNRHGKLDLEQWTQQGIAYFDEDGFAEIPVSNLQLAGRPAPWGGGGYFRLIPGPIFHAGVKRILAQDGTFIFYTHPWEYDPQQPVVEQASLGNRFRHYVGLRNTEQKLKAFIGTFKSAEFTRCIDLYNSLARPTSNAA